jgi:outer membrane usher protein
MYGVISKWAMSFGTLRADLSASRADFAATGSAARLQYRYMDTVSRSDSPSWTAVATYRSPTFTTLGDTFVYNPYALELGLAYSHRLFWKVLGTLGMGKQIGRAGQPDGTSEDLTLYRSFRHGIMASLLLSRRHQSSNRTENRGFLSLTWNFSSLDTVTASHDSTTDDSRLSWHHTASRRVRSADSDLIFSRDRSGYSTQGALHYRDYRFSADTVGSFGRSLLSDSPARSRLSITLGTALAFADGRVAISRPITDSFVIISPHPSLSGQTLEVNSGNGIPAAKTDLLGAAVLPEVLSYDEQRVETTAPKLPPWINLGPQPRYITTAYRSGTLLVAGMGADVIIQGLLVDTAGLPLPSEPGDLQQLDAPELPPLGFFTAKTGRFAVAGLKPGRLRLVLRNYPDSPVVLTIPPRRSGIVDVGTVKLSPSAYVR